MQNIVILKPYRFVPPYRNRFWSRLLVRLLMRPYLRRFYGLERFECIGGEKLRTSLDAGHGILIISNHVRQCDPMACGYLTRVVRHPMYCMASRHVFENAWIDRVLSRRCGAFSVYREGTDHASLQFAVQSLVEPDRPVVIFAEGSAGRMNDRVQPMLDGSALIARTAARRRAKQNPAGKVVIHPLAFKYFFRGNLRETVEPVLQSIERRLEWPTDGERDLLARIRRIGGELLRRQEIKFLGKAQGEVSQGGCLHERIEPLIESMLSPLEKRYATGGGRSTYIRVQQVRTKLLPDLIAGNLTDAEATERRTELETLYWAQEMACFPRDYLGGNPTTERILETVERLEESLTDRVTVHRPFDCVMQVGDAIEVPTRRERPEERNETDGTDAVEADPLTLRVELAIQTMIDGICERGAAP
ncbi:MAG: 1-acyl-sn-glycerol-3-phosphate acyltransferase [Planctomycetota bacterium]|nr:1-acyl-sn-glycerol-3-phosphate acyltransferase [Planctomycetota bacterium]